MNIEHDIVCRYRNLDEVPLFLDANDIVKLLGVSRSNAYEIFRSDGFPVLFIGGRKMVRKDKLISWLDSKEIVPTTNRKAMKSTSSTF